MRDRGFVYLIVTIVLAFVLVILIAVAMAKPRAHSVNVPAAQSDPHFVEVSTPTGNVPCIVYVNEYHPDNGGAISCDWSKR